MLFSMVLKILWGAAIVRLQGSYEILKINFQSFSRPFPDISVLFPDLTFPYDLPMSNTGTVIFNTIYVKLCQKIKSAWKIIFFFHINRPKNLFFRLFQTKK